MATKTLYIVGGIIGLLLVSTGLYMVYVAGLPHQEEAGKPRLVVYTYDSLFAYGVNPNKTREIVFTRFEQRYNCIVEIHYFDSSGEALNKVIEEVRRGDVKADVILGIDNIQVIKAKQNGVLEKYRPSNLSYVPQWLIESYDPELYAVPFDYGIIALVYNETRLDEDTRLVMQRPTLEAFYNPALSSQLVVENPSTSSTGLSFLLYEIAVYEKILGRDWRDWWRYSHPEAAKSWGDAFDVFYSGSKKIMVSYGTDPAYGVIVEGKHDLKASLATYNGTRYAWLQIEGAGIVKGAPHRDLAEKFIEWLLSIEVQSEIPLSQWMYPVNEEALDRAPREFLENSINPHNVTVLNTMLSQQEIADKLDTWIDEWLNLASSGREQFEAPGLRLVNATATLLSIGSHIYYAAAIGVSAETRVEVTAIYINGRYIGDVDAQAYYAPAPLTSLDIQATAYNNITVTVGGEEAVAVNASWIIVAGGESTIVILVPAQPGLIQGDTINVALVTRYGYVYHATASATQGSPLGG